MKQYYFCPSVVPKSQDGVPILYIEEADIFSSFYHHPRLDLHQFYRPALQISPSAAIV
ncbi:hypothetical protein [Arachidicoccus rhizosphaerae]|uniref:hypothetical protein n=1 Tax=Arachidicoccus rhizosphaerae TaxID=551991 RepID=UPI001FCE1944|nr:hypothetical protein [Arachidicoccus rhizosphaerae]